MAKTVTCPHCSKTHEVDMSTGPKEGSFTNALRTYMKANPDMTRTQVCNHFRSYQLPSGELVSLSTISTQYQVAHTLRKEGKL